ncbi:Cyclase-associated protein 1, partial [Ananas comosus]
IWRGSCWINWRLRWRGSRRSPSAGARRRNRQFRCSVLRSVDPSISALDELVESSLGRVLTTASAIGGEVYAAAKILEETFLVQRELLIKAKQTKKPSLEGMAEFVRPLNEAILKANCLTEGARADCFNHLKAVADSLTALAWIAYSGKDCGMSLPTAHVEESWQMAEFYNNKVLVEYKNKESNHVEWAKALKELYSPGLRDYVKRYYPLGLEWGQPGSANVSARHSTTTAVQIPAEKTQSAPSQPKAGMSAVFQEISSGKSVTAGLRKVTDDMKSKNRSDKAGIVSASEKETVSGRSSISKRSTPKFELQMGRKWAVENQIGEKNLVIDDCDAKQSVYVYGCKDSVLQVKGKVNNITIDKCTKMGILFKDVVAACEIVNCNSIEVQCEGSAPTISIDNTSGCQLYLGKDSLETSITTAKSSEVNVLVPGASPDGDWAEHPLPQQFVHTFRDGQFTTSPVSHSG